MKSEIRGPRYGPALLKLAAELSGMLLRTGRRVLGEISSDLPWALSPPGFTSRDSQITNHDSHASKTKSACHPVPAECQALLGTAIRQLFAFACPSYPCSGFPEPAGVETTHRPDGSRNSSPMTYPSRCGWQ